DSFQLTEVLGYPHAGNDVFYAKGIYCGKKIDVFIKVNRQLGADVQNEIQVLKQLDLPILPQIIDYNPDMTYRVSVALHGERLSTILGDNSDLQSMDYLSSYGKMLATLHGTTGQFSPVKDRKFFHIPSVEYFQQNNLSLDVRNFLVENQPQTINKCFCHGDFHYANILWQDKQISGILDFELSGIGNKEFDIAWAIILRPGQRFLREPQELDEFLRGYSQLGTYNRQYVNYYMVQIYCWFFAIGNDEYKQLVTQKINQIIASF
ncbi:MAG: aminoglycoside phosphotransferase family protein, partial [Clostridia bacterium]|nr:aminoglycoside phosphotransferase family protein [Clostridia bacterium]